MATEPQKRKRTTPVDESPHSTEIKELGENTGWAMWNEAVERSDQLFANTGPPATPQPAEAVDRHYLQTQPAALAGKEGSSPPDKRVPSQVSFDDVMVEARRNNRVCPKPRHWAVLYAKFAEWTPAGTPLPSPPMTGDVWQRTPSLSKRTTFRGQVTWADSNRCLPQLMGFLQGLQEDDWHHMGE